MATQIRILWAGFCYPLAAPYVSACYWGVYAAQVAQNLQIIVYRDNAHRVKHSGGVLGAATLCRPSLLEDPAGLIVEADLQAVGRFLGGNRERIPTDRAPG